MEDLDAGRAKPESVQQAYDDLCWLGMDWDAFVPAQGLAGEVADEEIEAGVVVQSRRVMRYERVLEMLWQRDAIYPCTCSRAEIAAAVAASVNAPHEGEYNVRYPGTCAAREWRGAKQSVVETTALVQRETGRNVCWRLRVPPGVITFDDLIAGRQQFDVGTDVGDFPVTRFSQDGTLPPAYQLACVTDDHAMGIDMIIRGDDLLSSTPRQMLIYRALNWPVPRFAHVPLVIGADGKRLAKRHGESRIAEFRAQGITPESIVGWAAWRSGQLDVPRTIAAKDITALFRLDALTRERIVIGHDDLTWLSSLCNP